MNWELIGKLGGGGVDVQKIPVNIVADGDNGSTEGIIVTVPEGETWIIAISGMVTPSTSVGANAPQMMIGEKLSQSVTSEEYAGFSAEVEGPASVFVGLRRNRWPDNDRLDGYLYTVPLGPGTGNIGGGEDAEISPLVAAVDGPNGSTHTRTVTIPDGETYIVGIEGEVVPGALSTSSSPVIFIGDIFESRPLITRPAPVNFFRLVEGPATFDVGIRRQTHYNSDPITSNVYAVPLPN